MIPILSSKKSAFGKYDIRGLYPKEVDEELVREVTKTLAAKLFSRGRVVIGHDVRTSSPSLYETVKETLEETGHIEVVDVGLATTPMLYFLVNDLEAEGGIMVTASHNPKEHNGLKVMGRGAVVVSGEEVYEMLR